MDDAALAFDAPVRKEDAGVACGGAGRTVCVVDGRERPGADAPCPRCGRRPEVVRINVIRGEGPFP